jgi:hypothetical protein
MMDLRVQEKRKKADDTACLEMRELWLNATSPRRRAKNRDEKRKTHFSSLINTFIRA